MSNLTSPLRYALAGRRGRLRLAQAERRARATRMGSAIHRPHAIGDN